MTGKKMTLILAATAMVLVGAVTVATAADATFEGVGGCKMCHKKEKSGDQYGKWSAGPHAGAYATLASPEAKEAAAKLGIDDPQKADACLKCHVTGHGVDAALLGKKYAVEDGVGCESCHGAGSEYKSMKVMKAITSGETDGATVGLVAPTAETCTACHNEESPTFKGFNYEEYSAKIAHPIPAEHKATYQK
jgi:hypothetical protein